MVDAGNLKTKLCFFSHLYSYFFVCTLSAVDVPFEEFVKFLLTPQSVDSLGSGQCLMIHHKHFGAPLLAIQKYMLTQCTSYLSTILALGSWLYM